MSASAGRRPAIGSSSGAWRGSVTINPHVRVLDVAQEVLIAPGVVEADDRRTRQRGATEREQVVGRVVEEHADVQRPAGRCPSEEQL